MLLLSTVVSHPDFYYHLTTIDGIDLPYFAFSVTESQIINNFFCPAYRGKTGQKPAFQEADRIWTKILFVCHYDS